MAGRLCLPAGSPAPSPCKPPLVSGLLQLTRRMWCVRSQLPSAWASQSCVERGSWGPQGRASRLAPAPASFLAGRSSPSLLGLAPGIEDSKVQQLLLGCGPLLVDGGQAHLLFWNELEATGDVPTSIRD